MPLPAERSSGFSMCMHQIFLQKAESSQIQTNTYKSIFSISLSPGARLQLTLISKGDRIWHQLSTKGKPTLNFF